MGMDFILSDHPLDFGAPVLGLLLTSFLCGSFPLFSSLEDDEAKVEFHDRIGKCP